MSDAPDIRLFTFPGSNAATTAELLLAHINVAHERVVLRPGLHAASLKLRGFPEMTVPALQIDERRISGSRAIALYVADELTPDAGLLPDDAQLRERVLEAERQGERLQNAVRRMFYAAAAQEPAGVRALVAANFGELPGSVHGVIANVLARAARYGHSVQPENGPDYVARVIELLDAADELMADGLIGTDTPNVADFQFAPNIVALGELLGPMGEQVRSRPIWAPMHRLLPAYPVTFGLQPPVEWLHVLATSAPTGQSDRAR